MKFDNTLNSVNGIGEWESILQSVFNFNVPQRHTWESFDDIVTVLQKISAKSNFQKLFYPLGGALEIAHIKPAQETGCLEFYSKVYSNFYDIIKPKSLQFEGFLDDPRWNYFHLEADVLKQSAVNLNRSFLSEQLAVLPTGEYINITHAESGEYNGELLVQPVKKVIRHFEGSFLICPIASPYNQNSPLYDGKHRTMSRDELREYVQQNISQ